MRQVTDLERVAYHEAGHAVAGFLLRRSFAYVTIESAADSLGHCDFAPLDSLLGQIIDGAGDHAIAELRRGLITVLAGPAAEERFAGPYDLAGEDDTEQAVDLASVIAATPNEARALAEAAFDEARGLWSIAAQWAAVAALAAALLERNRLSYEEARALVAVTLANVDA